MSYSNGYGAQHAAPQARQGDHAQYDDTLSEDARFMGVGENDGAEAYTTDGGGNGLRSVVHGAGALGSIALMVWVGVWGYGQVMRDVTGVPVVQAIDGPMRERPDQPGGQISEHKGLAVNAVKAGTPEQTLSEDLRLAPSGAALAEEDVPRAALAPRPRATVSSEDATPAAPAPEDLSIAQPSEVIEASLPDATSAPGAEAATQSEPLAQLPAADPAGPEVAPDPDSGTLETAADASPVTDAVPAETTDADALALALSQELAQGLTSLSGDDTALPKSSVTEASLTEAVEQSTAQTAPIPSTAPGVARSPRPASRPDRFSALETAPTAAAYVSTSAGTVAATGAAATPAAEGATIEPGTRLVQLGAFDTVEEARAAWGDIAGRFPIQMDGKAPVLQQAEAGGRSFWRLRAQGFADLSESRQFCSELVAQRTECIPVVAR